MKENYSLYLPTVWETIQAKLVFTKYMQEHAQEAHEPIGSPLSRSRESIIQSALTAVWMAGRQYEHKLSMKKMGE